MDPETLLFYNANAPATAAFYAGAESGVVDLFSLAFPHGARVLDLGCGSGRDLNVLYDAGYDAYGVDASPAMLEEARARFPRVASRLTLDQLPQIGALPDHSYDGVLCSAVLMHVPEELLFDSAFNLRRILKPGGRLLIVTPLEGPKTNPSTRRDENGRLFNGVTPENFRLLFEQIGFGQLNRWDTDDNLGRANRRWSAQLFTLESPGARSLDNAAL